MREKIEKVKGKYVEYYDKERFTEVDTNGDGYLDADELKSVSKDDPFKKYFNEKRYKHAD